MPGPTPQDLFRLAPTPGAHRVALRAGVSVCVPLLLTLTVGHPAWSLYAVFGAFTSLYGRNHVHLGRATMQASAAAALVACVVAGVCVGSTGGGLGAGAGWAAVAGTAVVAGLGALVASVQDWHPPGPLFLVFAFGAVASAPHRLGDVPVALAVATASAAFSLVVGNAGALLRAVRGRRPSGARARARLAPALTWQPVRCAVAVAVAGTVATGTGIGHPYWATVAAVAPLTARGVTGQLVRAGHRVVGTLLGLVPSALLLAPGLGAVATVLVVGVLQVLTELLVGRNYAVALVFITPMALLMGQLVVRRPVGPLLLDRGVETLVGAAVAVALVGLEAALRRRRAQRGRGAGR